MDFESKAKRFDILSSVFTLIQADPYYTSILLVSG